MNEIQQLQQTKQALQTVHAEKEALEQSLTQQIADLEETMRVRQAEFQEQIQSLHQELRSRVDPTTMATLQRALLTLQEAGIPVQFSGESDVPMPATEQVLMDKLHHLETSNSELRSTFNEIYNKYMASELERHRLEEVVRDMTSQAHVMEGQIAELEKRAFQTSRSGESVVSMPVNSNGDHHNHKTSVEMILKDQRDRYKHRVDELEVGMEIDENDENDE